MNGRNDVDCLLHRYPELCAVYMGIDPLASGNMMKVGKSDCEGTFAAMRRDDEDAPITDI
jgi:hypothetical protein